MAERSVLDLTLRSKKSGQGAQQATAELQGFNREVAKAQQLAKTLALGIAATAAAVVGFGLVAKKAFEFGKVGAELEQTELRFQRLRAEMGLSSTFLQRIQRETGGVASEFELMGSAMNLMSLGLVKNENQLGRLVRVSGELGFDMNQLVLTMANMTTMRFDALGVSVDGFKERVDALKASGLSAADAFREAFLAQAEDQLERVGSVGDTTLGVFKRLEAQIKNLGDATKITVAEALVPWIRHLVENLEATETLRAAVELAIITEKEFNALQLQRSHGMLTNVQIQEQYGAAIEAVTARQEASAEATATWNRGLQELTEQLAGMSQIQPTLAVKMKLETANVFDQVAEQLELLERGAGELALVAQLLPEVDWGLVDPVLRDMILGRGEALSMLVQADIEGMTPEQQAELKAQISEATEISPELVEIMWRDFQARGEVAVAEWTTSTLAHLRDGVSPAMQAAVDPLISGVGRFTRNLDALDGRRIKIYVDYIRRGEPPAGAPGGGGQHGLHFLVGGLPGPDRNLVTLRLTRGEEVSVTPRSGSPQRGMAGGESGGGKTLIFNNTTVESDTDRMALVEKLRDAFARL